jgi:protein-disulfide isomerase
VYHDARQEAQSGGVATRVVNQFFNLPTVSTPSFLSPFWKVRSTARFEDAPLRLIEYADLLCSDCLYLNTQLDRLVEEFAGKINIVFQFFPLEAKCNDVVDKDLHPGACDVTWMAAYDSTKFKAIHDEIIANFRAARTPEWRAELARRYDVEAALEDSSTHALVERIIRTGVEYEKTSDQYSHGIRSTPTLILNNRMIIGTFPYEQLRAIFQALVDRHEQGDRSFMENWVDGG